jgi:hypothetical protein
VNFEEFINLFKNLQAKLKILVRMNNSRISKNKKVKKHLNSLERALVELKKNMAHDRQANTIHLNNMEHLNAEIFSIKDSMSGMMELIVGEIDSIKKELYLDFGQNQRILLEDVGKLRVSQAGLGERWLEFEEAQKKAEE